MTGDQLVQLLLGLFGLANTALLVYQAVRLNQVHSTVNGTAAAAVEAAHNAGVVVGLMQNRPVVKSPTGPVGSTPTEIGGNP